MAYQKKAKSTHTMPDGRVMAGATHAKSPPPKSKKQTIKIGDSKITMEKGRLSRDLGIPEEKNIPMSLINRLIKVENGEMFAYKGKQKKMTPALKKRLVLARTLKGFKK